MWALKMTGKGLWLLIDKVLIPAGIVAVVYAWRWLSGATFRQAARPRYKRSVRATMRCSLTAVAVAAMVWPVATAVAVSIFLLVVSVTAVITRNRDALARFLSEGLARIRSRRRSSPAVQGVAGMLEPGPARPIRVQAVRAGERV